MGKSTENNPHIHRFQKFCLQCIMIENENFSHLVTNTQGTHSDI